MKPLTRHTPKMIDLPDNRIVLASASITRHDILTAAGVPHIVDAPELDECEIKSVLRARNTSGPEMAKALAIAKAMSVSSKYPSAMVLGADQVLQCGGETLDKPVDRNDALRQLRLLRGKTHRLISCAAIVCKGIKVWVAEDTAKLVVRKNASDGFLDEYLSTVGNEALQGPGGYRVEARGAQLFSRIDGSHFTILGLPLLPLLDYLRKNGVLRV